MTNKQRLLPRRALLSVSDKTGLIKLAQALTDHNIEIISTGGSARLLREADIDVKEVSDFTGFPEILDGRVKTLVPWIHGGILGKRHVEKHRHEMVQNNIDFIDLVCVNLYPFEETVKSQASQDVCIENIDIGGPAMIRAAAKNFNDVVVLTDPNQYDNFISKLSQGGTRLSERRAWAAMAYAVTANYDAMIASWFSRTSEDKKEDLPQVLTISGKCDEMLRYGENPHQKAAFYKILGSCRPGLATARQINGKALSYNNLTDTEAAFEVVSEFKEPSIAIIKHANPCGVASAPTLTQAWDKALRCDSVSAFGGIIATNYKLDKDTAAKISKLFIEVIVAPAMDKDAYEILSKKKNLRLLVTGDMPDSAQPGLTFRSISGGFLVQTRDNGHLTKDDLKVVTKKKPTSKELDDLLFAFSVAKHVKSNAIIFVRDKATVGIGAGQMSRVDSARIAVQKNKDAFNIQNTESLSLKGSVAASDAFFPFADGLENIIEAGVTAVIQPGGSIRDEEVIEAADKAGIAMVFTGMRHFKH